MSAITFPIQEIHFDWNILYKTSATKWFPYRLSFSIHCHRLLLKSTSTRFRFRFFLKYYNPDLLPSVPLNWRTSSPLIIHTRPWGRLYTTMSAPWRHVIIVFVVTSTARSRREKWTHSTWAAPTKNENRLDSTCDKEYKIKNWLTPSLSTLYQRNHWKCLRIPDTFGGK